VEEHVQELLPGYALGCLDENDLLQVARHLPRCTECRVELETYFSTADQLALAAPVRIPPPQLKSRIMAAVEVRDGQRPATAAPAALSQQSIGTWLAAFFGQLRPSALALGAVVTLLVILSLGISNLLLWGQVTQLQDRVPAEHVQIVNLYGTYSAPGAQGYLMVFADEPYGTLVVEDVPILEADYQYQLWLIRDGKRTSGGVFSVDEHGYGTIQVNADQPLELYPSFGVTIEPAGGSPGPTGEKVLGGDL
jgi:anti-sigma-K factor RskA